LLHKQQFTGQFAYNIFMLAPSQDFTIDAAEVGDTRPAFSDSKKSIAAAPSPVQSSRPNWGKTWAGFLLIVFTYH
jgi:hypothetical protein